jgi:GNAT superfamily N-acetyltransferase
MNIIIKRPKKENIEELENLFKFTIENELKNEGVIEHFEDLKNEIRLKINLLNKDIESNGKEAFFLIAVIKNKIVGTIALRFQDDLIDKLSNGEYKNIPVIAAAYILPEYQGKGIGKALLNSIVISIMSRNIPEFCLDSGYSKAQKIWTKIFGNPEIVEKDFWGKGYDHMVWKVKTKDFNVIFYVKE